MRPGVACQAISSHLQTDKGSKFRQENADYESALRWYRDQTLLKGVNLSTIRTIQFCELCHTR
jgi:hypothetical protein